MIAYEIVYSKYYFNLLCFLFLILPKNIYAQNNPIPKKNTNVKQYKNYGKPNSYFETLWKNRSYLIEQKEFKSAENILKEFINTKIISGFSNASSYAKILIKESRSARKNGNLKYAKKLSSAATILAPNLLESHFESFLVNIANHDLKSSLISLAIYIKCLWYEKTFFQLKLEVFIFALLIGILVAIFQFIILIFGKKHGVFTHKISHFFPTKNSTLLSYTIFFSILFLPLIFNIKIIFIILIWLFLIGVLGDFREKIISLTSLFILIIIITSLPKITYYHSYPKSFSYLSYLSMRNININNFLKPIENTKPSYESFAIQGLRNLWSGDFSNSKIFLEKSLKYQDDIPEIWIALGNIEVELGNTDQAIEYYENAISLRKNYLIAYFNLSQLYWVLGEYSKGSNMYKKAKFIDSKEVARWDKIADVFAPYLVPPAPPKSLVNLDFKIHKLHLDALKEFWGYIGGTISKDTFFVSAYFSILIIILSWVFLKKFLLTDKCTSCGNVSCEKCQDSFSFNKKKCSDCYTSSRLSQKITLADIARQRLKSKNYHNNLKKINFILSIFFIGSNRFSKNSILSAFFMIVIFISSLFIFLYSIGTIPAIFPMQDNTHSLTMISFSSLVITYFISIKS